MYFLVCFEMHGSDVTTENIIVCLIVTDANIF